MSSHFSQRTKGVWFHWFAPETAEKPSDDNILFRLSQLMKRCSRLTSLKQQCIEVFIRIEQVHCWVTSPEPQGLNFVLPLHVWHAELENGRGSVATHRGCDPSATHVTVEWHAQ
jgi:hypothetical protein